MTSTYEVIVSKRVAGMTGTGAKGAARKTGCETFKFVNFEAETVAVAVMTEEFD